MDTGAVKTQVSLDPLHQNGQFMTDTRQSSCAIIDCHVHLYDCFDVNDFLTGANRNLRLAGRKLRSSEVSMPILMLTEASRENGFERLRSMAREQQRLECEPNGAWKVRLLPADNAAVIATNRSDQELLIISGRQIICSEGLEVLALATDQEFADDYPLKELASLVPKPRVNLTRFHGVFAPNSKHRILVTPARRGKGGQKAIGQDKMPEERRTAMTWAQRLKRVFNIDIESCEYCGGHVKVIACIEDQPVIDNILAHLKKKGGLPSPPDVLPESRAPPQGSLFG